MPECITQPTTEGFSRMPGAIDALPGGNLRSADSEADAQLACAVLELVVSISAAATLEAAGVLLVNRLKHFLGAEGVALGIVKPGRRRCRLTAIAGAAEVNRGSELSVAVEYALDEVALNDDADGAWAPGPGGGALQSILPGAAVERCRLVTETTGVKGALVAWGSATKFDRQRAQRILKFSREPLAAALRLRAQAQVGRVRRFLGRALGSRRWLAGTSIVLLGIGVFLQLPYRIACDCAVEPLKRRFIAAPFAGIFEKSLVRIGDVVAENDVLGRMDGHALRLELAAVMADQQQARKSHDVNLAAGKVAAAQIDKLELKRLEQQRTLLENRITNIDIKSPVAGYVISGDMERSEGAPLKIGDVLYEIAPLDQMIVEVAIDDEEVARITVGQKVALRFDAHPGETIIGRLSRIHPRSELRESQNVFVGEVTIENANVILRPGMKGAARIVVADESLLGGFVRRLWHSLAAQIGV